MGWLQITHADGTKSVYGDAIDLTNYSKAAGRPALAQHVNRNGCAPLPSEEAMTIEDFIGR